VWAACLVFFQCALLLGYLYADVISRRLTPLRQAQLHIPLLAAALSVSSHRAALFAILQCGRRPGIGHSSIVECLDRASICAAQRHQPARAGLVCADQRATRPVPSFRIVEPGFPAGALELSIAD